jgi:excinuclease UvrABC helicase subunit UvrB
MRKIFFDLLRKQSPAYPGDCFQRLFFDNDQVFHLTIDKKLTGYDINLFISKKIYPKSGARIVEHCLSDNAIKKISQDIQKKFKEAIYEFFSWDED